MKYAGFAVTPIKFGDKVLEPGEPVPYEPGRNYSLMIRHGQMAPYREQPAEVQVQRQDQQERREDAPAKRGPGRPRKVTEDE